MNLTPLQQRIRKDAQNLPELRAALHKHRAAFLASMFPVVKWRPGWTRKGLRIQQENLREALMRVETVLDLQMRVERAGQQEEEEGDG